MRVLFDTNVVLDVLLKRPPHARFAIRLFDHVARLDGLLGATTVTTIYYLATKAVGRADAKRPVRALLALFEVAAVTRAVLEGAVGLELPDFEDAVLHAAARNADAEGIVTRDPAGYENAALAVYTPEELLAVLNAGKPRGVTSPCPHGRRRPALRCLNNRPVSHLGRALSRTEQRDGVPLEAWDGGRAREPSLRIDWRVRSSGSRAPRPCSRT